MNTQPHRVLAASLLLFSALAAGHARAQKVDDPTQYEYEQVKKSIIIGKTTREEVRAKYGEPDSVHRASAREGGYEKWWSYHPSESHGEKVRSRVTDFVRGMMPGRSGTAAGVAEDHGVGARNVKGFSLYVYFDRNGVVEDFDQNERNDSRQF
jgi:hypothetical protein